MQTDGPTPKTVVATTDNSIVGEWRLKLAALIISGCILLVMLISNLMITLRHPEVGERQLAIISPILAGVLGTLGGWTAAKVIRGKGTSN
jgi:hypothetical protein